jgi:hypothetical protein
MSATSFQRKRRELAKQKELEEQKEEQEPASTKEVKESDGKRSKGSSKNPK